MKHLQMILLIGSLVCLTGLAGCQAPRKLSSREQKAVRVAWHNAYQGDPSLAGVEINQYFDATCRFGLDAYRSAHPAQVKYYFWDGRIRTCQYAPNGVILERSWNKEKATPGSPLWDFVDFGLGSDPQFKTHADPRRKVQQWRNLHAGDPTLAGIRIMQKTEGCAYEDKSRFDHRHPSLIEYYFWDGRERSMFFTPYGDVRSDSLSGSRKRSPEEWQGVDFSYGSDPQFNKHKDPRIQ